MSGRAPRMRWLRPLLVSALAILFAYTPADAQQNQPPERPQDIATAYATADKACKAIWEDHAFDPMRDKFALYGQKPTVAMLTNRTRLLAKDKPLANLAIKALEKCRKMYSEATALMPQQTIVKLRKYELEQD